MKTDFGTRLRDLRKARSLTQAQLAEVLGKSPSAVRMWELGSNEPDMKSLLRMANLFECSLDYLLCREKTFSGNAPGKMNAPVYACETCMQDAEPLRYKSLPARFCSDGFSYLFVIADTDAMEPFIRIGDTVLVRKQDSCLNGQIVLVCCHGNCMLRKLIYQDGGIVLQPLNSSQDAVFVPIEQVGTNAMMLLGIAVKLDREI